MEENLQQVSTMIGNLRNMACDMGNEIENQNVQIERIKGKTEISQVRIGQANKRAQTLLKS
jgi:synaptosomal-associated protein 25